MRSDISFKRFRIMTVMLQIECGFKIFTENEENLIYSGSCNVVVDSEVSGILF
jgi:hypothetical protein